MINSIHVQESPSGAEEKKTQGVFFIQNTASKYSARYIILFFVSCFFLILFSSFDIDESEVVLSVVECPYNGGTISTEMDLRGNQQLIVDSEDEEKLVTKVTVTDSSGKDTVINGCGSRICIYDIEFLPIDTYTVVVETSTGYTFTGGFRRE